MIVVSRNAQKRSDNAHSIIKRNPKSVSLWVPFYPQNLVVILFWQEAGE